MTYAEAVAFIAAYENALTSGAGVRTLQIGDRQITYASDTDSEKLYNRALRDVAAYQNRAANRNPTISTARWK